MPCDPLRFDAALTRLVTPAPWGNLQQYGTQIVPVEDRLEKFLQMPARKGMQLVGFVTNDPDNPAIPRHHYMKVR